MDFVSDAAFNGKRFAMLAIGDDFLWKYLSVGVEQGVGDAVMVAVLQPQTALRDPLPGRPTDNAIIVSD